MLGVILLGLEGALGFAFGAGLAALGPGAAATTTA